jgi:hypothetical protein
MKTFLLISAVLCGSVVAPPPLPAQRAAAQPTLHVFVDVPDSSGLHVTVRYVEGPDSLKGTTREVVVPGDFVLHVQPVTLVAERTKGHGMVRLRVEVVGRETMGQGTGDRVRIAVSNRGGVRVNVVPWWFPS